MPRPRRVGYATSQQVLVNALTHESNAELTNRHRSRMLLDEHAADAQAFDIRPAAGGMRMAAFITGGVNGKSAQETAVGNLADMSEYFDEELALYTGGALPTYFNGARLVATAKYGLVRMADDVPDVD